MSGTDLDDSCSIFDLIDISSRGKKIRLVTYFVLLSIRGPAGDSKRISLSIANLTNSRTWQREALRVSIPGTE